MIADTFSLTKQGSRITMRRSRVSSKRVTVFIFIYSITFIIFSGIIIGVIFVSAALLMASSAREALAVFAY